MVVFLKAACSGSQAGSVLATSGLHLSKSWMYAVAEVFERIENRKAEDRKVRERGVRKKASQSPAVTKRCCVVQVYDAAFGREGSTVASFKKN